MPIYEFECSVCGMVFEKLELSIRETPTSLCPCGGVGKKVISTPAIVYSYCDDVRRLPDWDKQNYLAKKQDARTMSSLAPLSHDRGQDIKVYETDFGKTERRILETKAQLDNMG